MSDDLRVRAEVIKDSISPWGVRLTTIEATFNRFVLAEFNTHRVFSRNSASSRAIPFPRQLERVSQTPAMPVEWRYEQKGMQGGELLSPEDEEVAIATWLAARDDAIKHASTLHDLGVHKSIKNRLLEPFMFHTVIVTATDWQGFWGQRCSKLAQPEIRVAAEAMKDAYDLSEPTPIGLGDWHLPYIFEEDISEALREFGRLAEQALRQVSVARCARVSYLTHDGHRSLEADLNLYNRLVSADPMHASPLEHVATPNPDATLGNLFGWSQLRHHVEFEKATGQEVRTHVDVRRAQ